MLKCETGMTVQGTKVMKYVKENDEWKYKGDSLFLLKIHLLTYDLNNVYKEFPKQKLSMKRL